MKLAISNIAWDKQDNEHILAAMKEYGFQYIEIAPTCLISTDMPYADKNIESAFVILQAWKEKYQIHVCSMQSILYGVQARLFASTAERDMLMESLESAMKYAQKIGCPNLVFGSPQNRVIEDWDTQYEIGVDFFSSAAKMAQRYGVVLAIEANPPIYKTNYINNTVEALKLIKQVNHPHFKYNLDLGSIIENKETLGEMHEAVHFASHVHISEPYLNPLQKKQEHTELIKLLLAEDYQGAVSIEMKNSKNKTNVFDAIKYMSKIVKDIQYSL